MASCKDVLISKSPASQISIACETASPKTSSARPLYTNTPITSETGSKLFSGQERFALRILCVRLDFIELLCGSVAVCRDEQHKLVAVALASRERAAHRVPEQV